MDNRFDVIIVGGGPAGLTAALYLARAKYRVLVMEKEKFGGQITITDEIVNYPGAGKTSGMALTEQMKLQAQSFGAEFVMEKVTRIDMEGDIKQIFTDSGKIYESLGVVLALGASPRKLGFVGEKEFQGRGVAYCATCDGEFFAGREVLVVGGGLAAVEEAMFLTKYATKVTILVRKDSFAAPAGVVDKLKDYPTISVRFRTEVMEAGGDGVVSCAKLRNNATGEISEYRAADGGNFGIFVFAGYEPATGLVKDQVQLDRGYIITDKSMMTSVPGIFAAGDVCVKELRQVVTATADGAIAATNLEKYVSAVRERLGLPEFHQQGKKTELPKAQAAEAPKPAAASDSFISNDLRQQLASVFNNFRDDVTVVAVRGQDAHSAELEGFAMELKGIHPKVHAAAENGTEGAASHLDIRRADGSPSGIRFYSVPGGHEFNSFVIALYNVAGPGKAIPEALETRIRALSGSHRLQVMTTLSCTNCPEVVMGTQKIASLNPGLEAEMYDLAKYPEYKSKYNIMAVPCLIIDGKHTVFGKRNLEELVEILEQKL